MNPSNSPAQEIDASLVQRLAALNGLDLALDRAAALAPSLRAMLAADDCLAALDLGTLPATGLPWAPFLAEDRDDERR